MECIQRLIPLERQQDKVNVVSTLALIAGVATAICCQILAKATGAPTIAFLVPGAALAVGGIVMLILNNCCERKVAEEANRRIKTPPPPSTLGGTKTPPPPPTLGGTKTPPPPPTLGGTKTPPPPQGEEPASATTSSSPQTPPAANRADTPDSSDEEDGDELPPPPSPGSTSLDFDEELAQALAMSEQEGSHPPQDFKEYRVERGYNGKHPEDPVRFPCDVRSVLDEKAEEEQITYLDRKYYYQATQAVGDCFFLALVSGLLHRALAEGEAGIPTLISTMERLQTEAMVSLPPLIEALQRELDENLEGLLPLLDDVDNNGAEIEKRARIIQDLQCFCVDGDTPLKRRLQELAVGETIFAIRAEIQQADGADMLRLLDELQRLETSAQCTNEWVNRLAQSRLASNIEEIVALRHLNRLERIRATLSELQGSPTVVSLAKILLDHDLMDDFVLFFRGVAAAQTENIKNLSPRYWADEAVVTYFGGIFQYGCCITQEHPEGWTMLREQNGFTHGHEGAFAIISRNNNHYDALLKRELLAHIGVPDASSGDATDRVTVL
ncbi:MAG: hypothetical protein H7A36_04630 [Chlamydiales bacterium]|nr:hypothetical protein [Chlamydiales bacterium]